MTAPAQPEEEVGEWVVSIPLVRGVIACVRNVDIVNHISEDSPAIKKTVRNAEQK